MQEIEAKRCASTVLSIHRRDFYSFRRRSYVPPTIPSMETSERLINSPPLYTFVCPSSSCRPIDLCLLPCLFYRYNTGLWSLAWRKNGWITFRASTDLKKDVEKGLKVRLTSASRGYSRQMFLANPWHDALFCSAGDEAGRARVLLSCSLCASCKVRGSKARSNAHRSMPRACSTSNCNDAVYCRI